MRYRRRVDPVGQAGNAFFRGIGYGLARFLLKMLGLR